MHALTSAPSVTRRTFLQTSALVAGAFATSGRLRAADTTDRFAGFVVGLQSYTLRSFSIDKALDTIRDLDVHGVELFDAHFPMRSTDDQITAMKDKTQARGIRMLGHGVNPFTKDHAANRKWFEFAKKAGIKNISADPTEDAFDSLDNLCAEFNIRIAIHNHGPGARYDKVTDVLNAVRDRHPNIGACADLGHYIRSAEDPVRVIHLLKGRLFGIHLKDFAERKSETHGVILGKGHLDTLGVFKALREVEFPADGCLSLEYEEKPDNPVDDVRECLAIAAEAAQQSKG